MNASTLPNVGTKVIVTFRTDGNCNRRAAAPVQHEVVAVYTDKDKHGNAKVKLSNGDVFYVKLTQRGWYAVS